MEHKEMKWWETITAGCLLLIPTALCLFIKKNWILKYQRELLTCSLGTIFAIVFVDLIPELIEDAAKQPQKSRLFSASIFAGIAFAFIMNSFHDICDKCKYNTV